MILSWVALLLLSTLAEGDQGPHRSVIILGVNEPFEATQSRLRYADDDAARFYEMLEGQVDHLELLTVLDEESQSLFPQSTRVARPPRASELTAALERARAAAQEARASGHRTELLFVYTGHGRVQGGEGEVKLRDGTLNRTTLTREVLESQDFDRIHLVVDACDAYHLVNARGDDPLEPNSSFDEAFEHFVQAQSVDRFPTVGAVLSTNGPGVTHEWSRLQGGIFSHEVRSALAGAADIDGDGRVRYSEVAAFLAAANLSVPLLKGKPRVFVHPPSIEQSAVLVELPQSAPHLELSDSVAGHYYLEDDRGLRYAELHKAAGHQVSLRLVPRPAYALMQGDGATVLSIPEPKGRIRATPPLVAVEPPATARGDALPPGLFAEPFGPAFWDGFRAHSGPVAQGPALAARVPEPDAPSTAIRVLTYTAAGLSVVAVAGTIWRADRANAAFQRYEETHNDVLKEAYASDVRSARQQALALGIGATATAVSALVLWLSSANP